MTAKPRRLNALVRFALGAALFGTLLWDAWITVSAHSASRQAYREFVASRKNVESDVDSPEFAVRGLRAGFDEAQVDLCMDGAEEVSARRAFIEPRIPGSVKDYYFSYGAKYRPPFSTEERSLVSEWYMVYFNEQGKAVGVRRTLYIRGDSRSGTTDWALSPRPHQTARGAAGLCFSTEQ